MSISSKGVVVTVAFIASTMAFSQTTLSGAHPDEAPEKSNLDGHMKKTASIASFDEQFLDTMAKHHEEAVKMAELVDSRSAHDQLKQMAKKRPLKTRGPKLHSYANGSRNGFPTKAVL
ncbi:DUF305 domain-containing protein [Herbaspirillum huttiense]|jgi:uncharacterized protein (DUF305 family)|uniref:DUF305 domain-containing protein n=1 Tax=Herbaspirillum huttiense TaxID=863372 RepID=UPI002E772845|nr:DUF305 domain-containing protein [Herbaspirillum huttiense]MEE1639665.1 DUF305 domain-containing protein [Herbaspirillum huttiense NC40101]|tara:strand:+ start:1341 stop:1694 length:354 start_codon:yes stop_codon:yes gene_type:complete